MTAISNAKEPGGAPFERDGAGGIKNQPGNALTRVLLIDDDPQLCAVLGDYLSAHSFEPYFASTGGGGLEALRGREFDVVLLDMFLPDINGIEVLKEMRRFSRVPVIVLSAHNEETEKVVALEIGADDYVHKTFSPRELVARVKAVLRRSAPAPALSGGGESLVAGNIAIDVNSMEVRVDGSRVDLTRIEFQILYRLIREPERVFTREHLFSLIWDKDFSPYDRAIDMHISSLRRKLNDDSRSPMYVRTVRGVGYSFRKPRE